MALSSKSTHPAKVHSIDSPTTEVSYALDIIAREVGADMHRQLGGGIPLAFDPLAIPVHGHDVIRCDLDAAYRMAVDQKTVGPWYPDADMAAVINQLGEKEHSASHGKLCFKLIYFRRAGSPFAVEFLAPSFTFRV